PHHDRVERLAALQTVRAERPVPVCAVGELPAGIGGRTAGGRGGRGGPRLGFGGDLGEIVFLSVRGRGGPATGGVRRGQPGERSKEHLGRHDDLLAARG